MTWKKSLSVLVSLSKWPIQQMIPLAKKNGFPVMDHLSWHWFRRIFATRFIESFPGKLHVLIALLGHTTAATVHACIRHSSAWLDKHILEMLEGMQLDDHSMNSENLSREKSSDLFCDRTSKKNCEKNWCYHIICESLQVRERKPKMIRLETDLVICSALECDLSHFLLINPIKMNPEKKKKLSFKNTPKNKIALSALPSPSDYKNSTDK